MGRVKPAQTILEALAQPLFEVGEIRVVVSTPPSLPKILFHLTREMSRLVVESAQELFCPQPDPQR